MKHAQTGMPISLVWSCCGSQGPCARLEGSVSCFSREARELIERDTHREKEGKEVSDSSVQLLWGSYHPPGSQSLRLQS